MNLRARTAEGTDGPVILASDQDAIGRGAVLIVALFALPDRQRYVVLQRACYDRTLQDIATELHTSRQAVSLSEKHGLRKLRAALADVEGALAA